MNSFPIKQGFQPSFFSLVFYISTFFFYILISLVFIFSPFYIPPFLIYILFSSVFIFSSFYIPPFFFYILFSLVFIFSNLYFLYSTFTKGHIQLIIKFGNVPPLSTVLPPSPGSVPCRLCAV